MHIVITTGIVTPIRVMEKMIAWDYWTNTGR
jgi:hypothetical protein